MPLVYKDKSFCSGAGCLKYKSCQHALTEDVRASARLINMEICEFSDPKQLPCYDDPNRTIHLLHG